MSGFFKLLAVYRTRTLSGPHFRVISDPVTVESFDGPRSYHMPQQLARVHPIGVAHGMSIVGELDLPAGERFLALTARSKDIAPATIAKVEDAVDRVVALISVSLQPHIFFEQVYRGPVWESSGKGWASMGVRPGVVISPDGNEVHRLLSSMNQALAGNSEMARRHTLMSRFYSRSLQYDPSEEKFLLLWTALEIYPMCGSSHISPLIKHLSTITTQPYEAVKDKLGVGHLYGIRSKLVHDGMLPQEDRHLLFKRLELIVHAVMRSMCGLEYDKSLDEYF
jgi:hypothetical protein